MGCFNMTCSVSKLPITDGMAMRSFVVARPETPNEYTFYTTAFFTPLTPGIKGFYDDYGRNDRCTASPGFDAAAAHYFPQLKGDRDALLDSSLEETAVIRHFGEDLNCAASLAFVREDVYQKVLELGGVPASREEITKELTEIKGALDKQKALMSYMPPGHTIDPVSMICYGGDVNWNWRLLGLFRGGEGDLLPDALKPCRDKLIDMLDKNPANDPATVDFAMEMTEHLRFNRSLQQLCIPWQPTTSMVGQERPYDLQGAFNKAIHGICVKELRDAKQEEREFEAEIKKSQPKKPKKKAAQKPKTAAGK